MTPLDALARVRRHLDVCPDATRITIKIRLPRSAHPDCLSHPRVELELEGGTATVIPEHALTLGDMVAAIESIPPASWRSDSAQNSQHEPFVTDDTGSLPRWLLFPTHHFDDAHQMIDFLADRTAHPIKDHSPFFVYLKSTTEQHRDTAAGAIDGGTAWPPSKFWTVSSTFMPGWVNRLAVEPAMVDRVAAMAREEEAVAPLGHLLTTPCCAQPYVADPEYSRHLGVGTVLIPNDTPLTPAGTELVKTFDARFDAGESMDACAVWTLRSRSSGPGVPLDPSGEPIVCLNCSTNEQLLFHIAGRPLDNPFAWGSTPAVRWLDPAHRYAVTASGSLYTLDPAGFRPWASFFSL